jgi:hypothetical protein
MATLEQQLVFIRMAIMQAFQSEENGKPREVFSIQSTNKHHGTIVPLNNDAFEYSRIYRSILRLDELKQQWIYFAYTGNESSEIKEKLIVESWEFIKSSIPDYDQLRSRKQKQIKLLAYLVLYVFRSRVNNSFQGMNHIEICDELNIPHKNFKRDFFTYWQIMFRQYEYMDTDALMTVLNESYYSQEKENTTF